jgi:ribosome-associated protein
VNKLSTRAQLRINIDAIHGLDEGAQARLRALAGRRMTSEDEIVLESETYRSQLDNKEACVEKLRGLVRAALIRPKIRRKKRPSRAMIENRLETKRRSSEKKRLRRRGRWPGHD